MIYNSIFLFTFEIIRYQTATKHLFLGAYTLLCSEYKLVVLHYDPS
jgi:hypothetical protein